MESTGPPPPESRPMNSPWGVQAAAVAIVVWVLAAIFVGLRFLARRKPVRPGVDDWLILASLIPALGLCAVTVVWAAIGGLGWHSAELSLAQTTKSLQSFYAVQYFYTFTVTLIKVSILLLYKRIFDAPPFRIATYVCLALVLAWFTSTLLVVIFQCTPVYSFWQPQLAEHCIVAQAFFLGNGIASMLMDVIILCLPMPMVWTLQLGVQRKLALTGMFLLGSFVCVTSIVRITTLVGSDRADFSYTQSKSEMWSCVEPCIGIVCACLPTLGPLAKRSVEKASQARASRNRGSAHLASDPSAVRHGYSELEKNSRSRRRDKGDVTLDTIDMITGEDQHDIEMNSFTTGRGSAGEPHHDARAYA